MRLSITVAACLCLLGAQGAAEFTFRSAAGTFRLFSNEGGMAVASNHVVRFSGLRPMRDGDVVIRMHIPMAWSDGGAWQVDATRGAFPFLQPKNPRLYNAAGRRVSLTDPRGRRVELEFPRGTCLLLQDCRAWEWATFELQAHLPKGTDACAVRYATDDTARTAEPILDAFGQVRRPFAGKIASADDLRADVTNETAFYAALAFTNRLAAAGYALNRCGGIAGSGARLGLKRTGYFHVEQKGERWHLVDPLGDDFFQLGLCSFGSCDDYTYVEGREECFAWIPPLTGPFAAARLGGTNDWWFSRAFSHYLANLVRKFGTCDRVTTAKRNVERVRAAGFNSMGGFCPVVEAAHAMDFPYVDFVPLAGVKATPTIRGLFDPFDAQSVAAVRRNFGRLAKRTDDPLLIGYFLGNEEAFEDVVREVPRLDGTWEAKRRFAAFLRTRYDSAAAFNAAWQTSLADLACVASQPLEVTTERAFADAADFAERFVEAYYALIEREFRAVDPHHMLIGSRWQVRTANDERICRVAGRHLDVVSVNYYAWGIDEALMRRIYAWSGRKPQIWSEFFYSAAAEANPGPFSRDLPTQRERGLAYRNYVEGAASLGFVVGTQWFSLVDQSATGRFFQKLNGESFNNGILSVTDRPYRDFLDGACAAHLAVYPVRAGTRAPYRFADPRFSDAARGKAARLYAAGRTVAKGCADGRQDEYPLRPAEPIGADADFKVAWDDANLYVNVNVRDATPQCNAHAGQGIWEGDVVEIFVGQDQVEKDGPLLFTDRQFLLSARPNGGTWLMRAPRQPDLPVATERTATGYRLEVALPWSAIGRTPKAGDVLRFDVGIGEGSANGHRDGHFLWSGTEENCCDRTNWGRLALQP